MAKRTCLVLLMLGAFFAQPAKCEEIPPSWEILPIPRYVDYGSPQSFVTVKNVAVIRRPGSLYHTVRDKAGQLMGQSTIIEEELTNVLKENGVSAINIVSDNLNSYNSYDTVILLGNPDHNSQTAKYFNRMKLSFAKWDDPRTPGDDFTDWKDFGHEGYALKVGRVDGQNVIILAGYDFYDDNPEYLPGAGTFYAIQSLRQLFVKDGCKVKTAEIADKPLIAHRAAFAAFWSPPEQNQRNIEQLARMKANGSIYWYGDGVVGYNAQAAARFRYPWTQEQLDYFARVGKWCREHYISVVICMNPDHYNSEWAAPRTFDGTEKDPLHYDLNHPVEPQFKELWEKQGYDVHNDIDIIAAKFALINKAIGGGAQLQMMNEDDVFGLVHEEDKKLYHTDTDDEKLNAINYGKARATVLTTLYKKVRQWAPNSSDIMSICPPDGVAYQTPLADNSFHSQDFMKSWSAELKKVGLLEKMPVLTSGGGTLAESVSLKEINDFKGWTNGASVILAENNFLIGRAGSYETDPNGKHWPMQKGEKFPAGYRDKQLYTRLWGIQWNMNGNHDVNVLAWGVGQFMWNMLAHEKAEVDTLAVRKVSTGASYRLVKSLFDEFDRPIAYTYDDNTSKCVAISDRIAFPRENGKHTIIFTDALRKESQRLRDKLGTLLPQLEAKWEDGVVKRSSLTRLGYDAANFCAVYLARGYIKGWEGTSDNAPDLIKGDRLRDLLIEAEQTDQRFFSGPILCPGQRYVDRDYFYSPFSRLYTYGASFPLPDDPGKTMIEHVDIWKDGLLGRFFEPVSSVALSEVPDGDVRLSGDWGNVEEANDAKFRTVTSRASVDTGAAAKGRLLVRVKLGTGATSSADGYFRTIYSETAAITLQAGEAICQNAVCRPRWITWLLPVGTDVSTFSIETDRPLRVYAVEVYRQK